MRFRATVSYTGIDDYTYFTIKANDSTPTPQQFGERVDYLKIKAEREFRYGRFALMNTVMFQQAVSGEEVFNVPEIVTRHTLYYEDEWFITVNWNDGDRTEEIALINGGCVMYAHEYDWELG